jgi:hypothetical protein
MNKVNLKNSILTLAVIASLVGISQSTKAHSFRREDHDDSDRRDYDHFHDFDSRDYQEYDWNSSYWHHHRYGYWHHHWGYWSFRGPEHIFINID